MKKLWSTLLLAVIATIIMPMTEALALGPVDPAPVPALAGWHDSGGNNNGVMSAVENADRARASPVAGKLFSLVKRSAKQRDRLAGQHGSFKKSRICQSCHTDWRLGVKDDPHIA